MGDPELSSQEVLLVPFSICSIFLLFEQNIKEIKQAPVVQKVDNTMDNPLSPNGDQHQISPCNIRAL